MLGDDVPPSVKRFFLPVRPRVNAVPPPEPVSPDDPDAISLLPYPLEQVTGGQSLHALPIHRVYRVRQTYRPLYTPDSYTKPAFC